tara:strand:- start:1668 stop:2537 length:870 start_codon:yes stop_codon:yes gene_type:complete
MSEAIGAVKQEIKKVPMRYSRDTSHEDAELKRLEEERSLASKKEVEAKEDAEETSNLDAEEKTFKKRYGDLRRHMSQREEESKIKIKELQSQLSSATQKAIKLPKTDDEIAAWSKEYPDVAKIIESIAAKKAKEFDSGIEKRLQDIAEKEAEATRKRAEADLITAHPDFEEIRADEKFHEWVGTQPKWVQQALYENDSDAHAASRAIDLYKVDTGMLGTKKKKSNNDAAKAVTTRGQNNVANTKDSQSNQWRESDVAQMKADEYAKNEESIMEAIQSGNFIYDVSRAQR